MKELTEERIRLVIRGKPIPQQRPRFLAHPQRKLYDPNSKEKRIIKQQLEGKLNEWFRGDSWRPALFGSQVPVSVDLKFCMSRPKSHLLLMQKGKSVPGYMTGPPDTDNLCKFALDSVGGVMMANDCQVVSLHAEKCYTNESSGYTDMTIISRNNCCSLAAAGKIE